MSITNIYIYENKEKMWVAKEWVELFCNLQVLSADPATGI